MANEGKHISYMNKFKTQANPWNRPEVGNKHGPNVLLESSHHQMLR